MVKSLIKSLLPKSLVARLQRDLGTWRVNSEWNEARRVLGVTKSRVAGRGIWIVPSDPLDFMRSRGDEALVTSAMEALRQQAPDEPVFIITGSALANGQAEALGAEALQLWPDMRRLAAKLNEAPPSHVAVIGADMMDGYYSVEHTRRLLMVADLASIAGSQATFTGFSFNKSPAGELKGGFDRVADRVKFNLRDRVSYESFSLFTGRKAELVADIAFLLKPDHAGAPVEVLEWIKSMRDDGRKVIAINFHALLFAMDPEKTAVAVKAIAQALSSEQFVNVAWLLTPHDTREGHSDFDALESLYSFLSPRARAQAHLMQAVSAPATKAVMANVDGAVVGRMHLGIGALSVGTPIGAFAYQGKFAGLFELVNLPGELILAPADAGDVDKVVRLLGALLEGCERFSSELGGRLPAVRTMSAKTFEVT